MINESHSSRVTSELINVVIEVEGNPLENISVLEDVISVMKGGDVFKSPE